MHPVTSIQERFGAGARASAPEMDRARRVILKGLLVAAVAVGLLAVSQLVNFGVFNLRIQAFDSDYHTSVFGLASLVAQLAVAAASGWRGQHSERHRWAWFGLAALVAVLAIVREWSTFNATALAAPLVIVFVLLCWLTWRDAGVLRFVVGTGLVLMLASLVLHKVGIASDSSTASDYTWPYQILTVIKHGCELAGWTLVAAGIFAGATSVLRASSADDRERASTQEPLRLEMESVAP
jgi:hypothetical protein